MNTYPILILSSGFKSALQSLPTLPEKPIKKDPKLAPKPHMPLRSHEEQQATMGRSVLIFFIFVVGAWPIYFALASPFLSDITRVICLFIGGIFFLVGYRLVRRSQKKSYASQQLYESQINSYNSYIAREHKFSDKSYRTDLNEHEEKVKLLKSPDEIKKHRLNELNKSLNDNHSRFLNKKEFTPLYSGSSEEYFYTVLKAKFSTNIYRNYGFEFRDTTYLPDFIYYDYKGILIDIEIDEPYEQKSGKPIHYRGADDYRDRCFTNENFIIIRFSEEQIKRYADQCCSYIEIVRQAILDCEPIENIQSISLVPKIMQWSKEEAESMARRNYRSTY